MSPGVDGILGVGPSPLSRGTVSPDQSRTVLNVVDTAFDRRKISTRQLGVYFEPTISRYAQNGEVTIGGIDYGRTKGSLMWTPRSRKPGAVCESSDALTVEETALTHNLALADYWLDFWPTRAIPQLTALPTSYVTGASIWQPQSAARSCSLTMVALSTLVRPPSILHRTPFRPTRT